MMWLEHGLERRGRLRPSWFVVSHARICKDRVLAVDTPGQQVLPRVRYGTACLIIRDDVESVRCSDEWKISVVTHPGSHGARGAMVP
jgi:hypothetical protein